MADKHTPGPWAISGRSTINAGRRGWVASVSQLNREADARLIAAAPDLLEALRIARCNMSYLQVGDRDADGEELEDCTIRAWNSDLAKIDAAIAKATGTDEKGN